MTKITSIRAYEILSSGSTPTLEVQTILDDGSIGIASVAYGASAGSREAFVLLDEDKSRYAGKGMLKAVDNINSKIAPALLGKDAYDQRDIDETIINLDGTPNKEKLGGNATLGASLSIAHASAKSTNLPLYKYIRKSLNLNITEFRLPNPMMVVIEGGKHADNSTDLQEYIFSSIGNESVKENVRKGIEAYFALKSVLKKHGYSVNVGNEGAFAPEGIKSNEEPLQMMLEAIEKANLQVGKDIGFSIDAAASEFFTDGKYHLKIENKELTSDEIIAYFKAWMIKYPIITVEDMLDEADWDAWPKMTAIAKENNIINIGDDITVTNKTILQKAIDLEAINAILIKLNQIGTVTETVDTCMLARKYNMMTVPSHRGGGETTDTSMVDLAVAVNSGFIKVGPSRGERVCKYNRLMEIERELGKEGRPMGSDYAKIF